MGLHLDLAIWVVVTQMYTFVKTYQLVFLRAVYLNIYKIFFNPWNKWEPGERYSWHSSLGSLWRDVPEDQKAVSSSGSLKTSPIAFLSHSLCPFFVCKASTQPDTFDYDKDVQECNSNMTHLFISLEDYSCGGSWSSFRPHECLLRSSFWSMDFITLSMHHLNSGSYHGPQLLLSGLIIWCHLGILASLCLGDLGVRFQHLILHLCLFTSLEFWKINLNFSVLTF